MNRFLALIALGCLAVLALVASAYIELTRFRPEAELRRMLTAMSELTSVRYVAGVNWSEGDNERITTTVYAEGQARASEEKGMEHGTRFRAVRYSRSGSYADLSGEVRALNGKSYLFYEAPGPSVPGVSFTDGMWLSFEPGELAAWGDVLPGVALPIPRARGEEWDAQGIERLRAFLPRADVFHVQFDGQEEQVRGVDARVLDAWFDRDAVRAFLREAIRLREQREPTDEERVRVEEQASALERLTMRFWIGKSDHRLYRVQAAGAVPSGEEARLIPLDILIDLSGFDEPFTVTAPARSTAFRSLVGSALAGFFTSDGPRLPTASDPLVSDDATALPLSGRVDVGDKDGDGLDPLLETFYGTKEGNPDTDGDGYMDGDEVSRGWNPNGSGTLFGFGLGR